jgi:hypothetical protein
MPPRRSVLESCQQIAFPVRRWNVCLLRRPFQSNNLQPTIMENDYDTAEPTDEARCHVRIAQVEIV